MDELTLTTWLQRVRAWLELIEQRATGNQLSWAAQQAWGDGLDLIPISELEEQTAEGNTSWIPAVLLSSAEHTEIETTSFNPGAQAIIANSDWATTASITEIEDKLTSALAAYLYQKTTSASASIEQRDGFTAAVLENNSQEGRTNNQIVTNVAVFEAPQKALKKTLLSPIGTDSGSRIQGRASSTNDALYVPWKKGSLYENGYISKLSHSGELQWRKLIADVNQITTATDGDENLYTSWSRNSDFTKETRGSFIAKLNPDNGEIVWKTQLESHNYIINDLHAVGDTLYAVGQYKGIQRPLFIAVNRNDGTLLWQKEVAASDSTAFTEIDSDGSNLYVSSTSALGISGTVHQFKLDGSVVEAWHGSDRQKLSFTNTQDVTSVIVDNQIISAGKTSLDEFYDGTSWRLVSRNLQTGAVNWRQQWGSSGNKRISSITEFKGKIYVVTGERKGKVWPGHVQEISTQGELGRQIYFTAPTNATQDPQLVADGDKLFLINAASPAGDTEAGIVHIITGSETTGAISDQQNSSNQAPTLQLSGDSSITIQQDSEWSEKGWSASDPEDGDLSTNVNVTSPTEIDTSKPGTYELTYSVEDSEGLSTSVTRTIEVTPHRTGDNYYLALDGSDDNDGSIDQPFATFDHAKGSLKPGDTLHIRGGTYYQQLEINGSAGPKGDKNNPITVKAYEGETVVVSGAPPISTSWVKDGNRWKTNVWQGSDDLGTNKRNIFQLFLDDKLLTGARYPNLDHEWDQPDHSFWNTTRRANRQADSEEHSNYSIDGLDDIQGSVEGAVWYGLGDGPMLVQGHQQGSDVVQTAKNPRAQTGRWAIGSGTGWLMGALPLLDADREWFFDKETGDLYLQLADGIDPNQERIIARTQQHGHRESGSGLKVRNSDGWIFDGINLFATSLSIHNTRDLEFKNSKVLHPGYHDYMLSGTVWPDTNVIRKSARLKFTNNEFAYNYGTLIEYGGRHWDDANSLIYENNYFHHAINHMWGNNGGPIVRGQGHLVALKNTVVQSGWGGLGRPGWNNQFELNYIGGSHYSSDTGGITINQAASPVVLNRNWITGHLRNGIRFDGHPAGVGQIASHNVGWQNPGVALKAKGDQHKLHNNTLFANGDDLAMWEGKFYGYQQATDGPSVDILRNSEKYKNDSYDNIEVVQSFEIDDYKKDNYGAEISGYLTPKQDADYIFYLSSDDHSELWLSSNDDANNLVLVAKRDGATKFRDYDAGGTESTGRSVSIRLEAGTRYAIKALQREDKGAAHLSVSWGFAGENAPSDGAEPIASEYLSYDLGENNTSGLEQNQGAGLIVKYYETVGDEYETGRTWGDRRPGRIFDQDGNWMVQKGNHLSVAHNNAINSGPNPIKNPDDRTNNSYRSDRRESLKDGHLQDELRDWGNYDFRPKAGSSLIDAGLAIEGITIPFDGITDGIIGDAPDIGAYEYGDSQYWIAGHQEEKASFPIGARDRTRLAKPDLDLIWQEGLDAASNLVYFGTDPDQLDFKVEQTGNIYDPTPGEDEILSAGQTYYWRIDTKKSDDSIVKGDTWQFTVDTRPQHVEIESVYVDYQPGDHQYLVPKIHGGKKELSLPTYGYYISKYEITNSQYAAFLNDVAQYVNVGAVWDSQMQIVRESDPSGRGYIYTPVSGKENHPVTYVSWASATQFANWMSGEAGDIYGGNLNGWNKGFTTRKDNRDAWGAGAISLPSWEEWIKSAYYDRSTNWYYKHAIGRTGLITTNDANYGNTNDGTMPVGSYATPSFFGTYDQAGNVREMIDTNKKVLLGGDYASDAHGVSHTYVVDGNHNNGKEPNKGFRIVSLAAIQQDKDNNGANEYYITNYKNLNNSAPILENPRPSSDEQSDEQAEDNTGKLLPAEIGKEYSFSIADSAFDPEGGSVTFSELVGPDWLTLNANGELSGTPTKESHLGSFNIQYKATDETGLFSISKEPIELVVSQKLNATEDDDNLQTTFGTTWVYGLGGDDVITGSDQDETFVGGAGNDSLNGGAGIDRAIYSGNKENYSLELLDSGDVEITDLRETSPDGVDLLRDIEHLNFANGTRTIADAVRLSKPLSYEFISSFGTQDRDWYNDYLYAGRDRNIARPSYTNNQIILPWISNAENTENNKAYVRATDLNGELLWENLIGSYQTLATATDQNGDIYIAWSSKEPTQTSKIGKFDTNGELLWEASPHENHTIFDMVVIDDKIYTAGGAFGYKTGVIYSLSTDDGSTHWQSVQSNPIDYFIDIETDGKALYLSGTANGHGRGALNNTHSYKYDLDGNQVWYSKSNHDGSQSEEYGATIFENQLISAGKTHRARNSASGNFLVSRDLETGDVQWTKRLRDWGSKFVDIVTYKGTVYAASIEGSAAVIHELEKDGAFNTMGRQLWINLPNAWTKGWSFVIANDELYLSGTTTGDTGIAENQGGTDIFLAKITTGLENAEVPFSGISIIPTAPRDSEGNLQTSEDGSSTSFKVKLNQEPLTDEDVVVSLTGLDATEGSLVVADLPSNQASKSINTIGDQLSTNGLKNNSVPATTLTFNRSNWDVPQSVVITGIDDNKDDDDALYTIKATVSNSGGYKGTEVDSISIVNSKIDEAAPTFSAAATSTNATKVILTYNEALSYTTAPTSAFTVTTDGSPNPITAVAVSGSTVELTLTDTVKNDQTVTVAYTDPTSANDANAIQDSAGNDAATLSSTAVTNNSSVAGTAPTFVSAAISTDGTKLLLTYSETLSSTTAGPSAFSVTTDGNANAVTAVAVSGSTVELTLTNSVKNDQTVTVTYSDPSGANDNNAIQDSYGNDAASSTSTAVTNNSTVAGTAPTFVSAATSTDGTTVLLSYSETLSATSAAASAFSVTTDGNANAVTAVAISGSTVELTLASAITSGQTVALTYSDPSAADDSSAVQDPAGNDAASLDNIAVANNSTVDGNAPAFLSAATSTDGSKILLNYGETLSSTTADASAFSVTTDGSPNPITAVAISGSTVELALASAITSGQTVALTYSDPSAADDSSAVQDPAGNDAASLDNIAVANNSTVDGNAPAFLSAATSTDGSKILLNYGETLSSTTADASAFSVTTDGNANAVTAVAISGSTVELTLTDTVKNDQTVTVAYSDPSGANDNNAIQDVAGNDAATLASTSISNNSIVGAVDTGAPTLLSAATSTDGTTVLLNYNESLSVTTAAASAFSVTTDGNANAVTAVANSASTVELTLASAITSGQTVVLTYSDPSTADDSSAVQDSAGNDAASLDNVAVTNNSTVDGNAPAFLSASTSTDGTTVLLNYNETLSDITAAASAFSVTTDGSANAVTAVAISGSTVELTLASAITSGQTVALTYSDPSAADDRAAVQDPAGNDAASLDNIAVANNSTVDGNAPAFLSATTSTDGNTVLLSYSETLSSTTADASAFSVTKGSNANAVTAVAIDGSTVELTLASAITSGQTVALTYSDPSAADDRAAVQDPAGNDAASLDNIAVTNNSTVDGNAPAFLSAGTSTDGTKVILTYNEALHSTTAATSAFAVTTDGSSNTVAAVAIDGSTVELTLNDTVKNDQTLTVAYTDPSSSDDNNAIQDTDCIDAATLSGTAVTNNSTVAGKAPTFVSSAISTDGTKVVLTYSETLSSTTADPSAFSVTTDGSANAVTAVAVSGSTVELTLTNTVKNDQTVTIAYTDPSVSNDSSAIQDSYGNDVASSTSTEVTNNSTVAGTAPRFVSAATSTDGTTVLLNYSETLSATSASASAFSVTTDGNANAATAVAIDGSTVELTLTDTVKNDQTVTVAYSDPSGANDNNAIQDAAGNDAASLTSTAVTNKSLVGAAPTFVSAATSTDGTKVLLNYNKTLSDTTADPSAFTVTTDGIANAVTAVAIDGFTVALTLTGTVKIDQTVTVAYSDPSGSNDNNAIQDAAGNDAASLTTTAVTNNSTVVDLVYPTVEAASIDGDTLTISFNKEIAPTVPKANNFKVVNGRKKIKVEGVSVDTDTDTVVLSLKDAVQPTDNDITFDYKTKKKDQKENVIQDLAGNDLQSIKNVRVDNNTFVDPNLDLTSPTVTAASIVGDTLTINFNEDIESTVPKANNFKVNIGRKKSKVESIEMFDATKLLAADLIDAQGAATTDPNHNSITSEAEFRNLISVYASSTGQSATFTLVSPFDSSITNGVQATVGAETFEWNVGGHGANPTAGTGPHATRDGGGLSFTDAELAVMRTTSNTLSLTLKDAAEVGVDVTFDYKTKKKDQDAGVVEDLAGNDLQSFKGQPVSNDTFADPNVDSSSPTVTAASIVGDTLTINFNEDIDSTVPKANNFKVKIGRKKSKVESVTVDQASDSVVLALKNAAEANDEVTFDYKTKKKDQDTGVIQDLAGNDLQSFKGEAVTNLTAADAITGLSAKAAFPSTIAESNGEVVVDGDVLHEVNRGLGLAANPETDGSLFFTNAFSIDGLEVISPIPKILG